MGAPIVERLLSADVVDFPNTTQELCEEAGGVIAVLLALVLQYRDDLKRPPTGDSLERRLEAIEAAIAKATASLNTGGGE